MLTATDLPAGARRMDRADVAAYVVALLLAALVLAPMLAPGFVLSYDMVFTPQQPLDLEAVGVGVSLPRAVPVDAVVAAVETVVPGTVLQKAVLVGVLVGGALGAARLGIRTARGTGLHAGVVGVVAAAVFVWNPYVAERLVIGHWSLLVAYAALPWTVSAAWDVRRRTVSAWPRLLLLLALSAITATGGVIAAVAALACVGRRAVARVLLVAAVVNAPWIVPGALHPLSGTSDADGVAAFSLRPESWLGVLGSALSLGGIWNSEVVPTSREGAVTPVFSLMLLVLAALGATVRRPMAPPGARRAMAVLAATGLALALTSSIPGLDGLVRWVVTTLPGGGLLRDAHKWLALLALPLALAAGRGAAVIAVALRHRIRERSERVVATAGVAALAVLTCVASVPDLAWGVGSRLSPVQYPRDWYDVRAALSHVSEDEPLVVLPFQTFRSFPWNSGRTVLDPAPRWFRQDILVDDDLPLSGITVSGEDRRAAAVDRALREGDPVVALTSRGVRWVLVERTTPGIVPPEVVTRSRVVSRGKDLLLLQLPPGPVTEALPAATPPLGPVLAADLMALAAVAASVVAWVTAASARARRRRLLGSKGLAKAWLALDEE